MGNEHSQQIKYGEKLENDVKVTWKKVEKSNPFPSRDSHCACSIDNKLYVFGGVVELDRPNNVHAESNDLLLFNIDTLSWTKVDVKGDVPHPRSAASVAAVNKKIYLFGGLSQNVGWFHDVYVLNTETNEWRKLETKGTAPRARDKLATAVIKDKIYVFGGFGPQTADADDLSQEDDEEEDEDSDEEEGAEFGWFNDLFIFDTSSETWSQPMQMNLGVPTARAAHSMCSYDKYLVVFGGRDREARKGDLHIFDTESRKWLSEIGARGCQPEPRSFHTAITVDTRVVIMGGRGLKNQHFSDFHVFDAKTMEWLQPSVEGDIPSARGVHTATVVGDYLVLFGGSSNFSEETLQCQEYHSDVYLLKTADILAGGGKVSPLVASAESSREEHEQKVKRPLPEASQSEEGSSSEKKLKPEAETSPE